MWVLKSCVFFSKGGFGFLSKKAVERPYARERPHRGEVGANTSGSCSGKQGWGSVRWAQCLSSRQIEHLCFTGSIDGVGDGLDDERNLREESEPTLRCLAVYCCWIVSWISSARPFCFDILILKTELLSTVLKIQSLFFFFCTVAELYIFCNVSTFPCLVMGAFFLLMLLVFNWSVLSVHCCC